MRWTGHLPLLGPGQEPSLEEKQRAFGFAAGEDPAKVCSSSPSSGDTFANRAL